MQIIRASEMGFCFGVRRAVEMMEDAVKQRGPMVSLGSVVHNPQIVEKLRGDGLDVITDVATPALGPSPSPHTAFRASVIQDLEASGAEIIDTTCPIVTRSQQWAKRLSDEGFAVVIFGDPNHKEVRGVLGWARGHVQVWSSEDDVEELPDGFPSRVGVLSQTTEMEGRFASFVKALLEKNMHRISELRVLNTLCHATTAQQAATMHLAAEVDLMIVVGGRDRRTRATSRSCRAIAASRPTTSRRPMRSNPRWLAGPREGRRHRRRVHARLRHRPGGRSASSRWPNPSKARLQSTAARFSLIFALACTLGVVAWAADRVSFDSSMSIMAGAGNLPSHWLVTAFTVGVIARSRPAGTLAATLALCLAVAVYYAAISWAGDRPGVDLQRPALVWGAVALVAGPMFGLAGAVWLIGPSRMRPWAVALLSGGFLGEAFFILWRMGPLDLRRARRPVRVAGAHACDSPAPGYAQEPARECDRPRFRHRVRLRGLGRHRRRPPPGRRRPATLLRPIW